MTGEFNSAANSVRMPYVRVDPYIATGLPTSPADQLDSPPRPTNALWGLATHNRVRESITPLLILLCLAGFPNAPA
eukprot:1251100-Pyramimonas_sp.AAC.1